MILQLVHGTSARARPHLGAKHSPCGVAVHAAAVDALAYGRSQPCLSYASSGTLGAVVRTRLPMDEVSTMQLAKFLRVIASSGTPYHSTFMRAIYLL